MTESTPATCYRFGVFEADGATRELRRKGIRVKLHSQPFQLLWMLLERPGEMLTREEICKELWPDGTFVDYEHGVNSAVNRLREALGDKASNPRFVETLARRGYRFVGAVERVAVEADAVAGVAEAAPDVTSKVSKHWTDRLLTTPADLPKASHRVVQILFVLLQLMYLGFYVGALANLGEIHELLLALPSPGAAFLALIVTAAVLIPVRVFLLCAVLFHAPGVQGKFRTLWPMLLPLDVLWSLAPFLLLNHINYGLALACTTVLIYAPFAQRSLILMGAGELAAAGADNGPLG